MISMFGGPLLSQNNFGASHSCQRELQKHKTCHLRKEGLTPTKTHLNLYTDYSFYMTIEKAILEVYTKQEVKLTC